MPEPRVLTAIFKRGTATLLAVTGICEDETLFRNKPFVDLPSALTWLQHKYPPTLYRVLVTTDHELRRLLNG